MSPDPGQRNCAIEMYWQFGPATPELRAVLEVLEAWLTEPAFDQLRTKKTLGYSVEVGYRNTNEVWLKRLFRQNIATSILNFQITTVLKYLQHKKGSL